MRGKRHSPQLFSNVRLFTFKEGKGGGGEDRRKRWVKKKGRQGEGEEVEVTSAVTSRAANQPVPIMEGFGDKTRQEAEKRE